VYVCACKCVMLSVCVHGGVVVCVYLCTSVCGARVREFKCVQCCVCVFMFVCVSRWYVCVCACSSMTARMIVCVSWCVCVSCSNCVFCKPPTVCLAFKHFQFTLSYLKKSQKLYFPLLTKEDDMSAG